MAIPESTKTNFGTLIQALADETVCIVECTLDGDESETDQE